MTICFSVLGLNKLPIRYVLWVSSETIPNTQNANMYKLETLKPPDSLMCVSSGVRVDKTKGRHPQREWHNIQSLIVFKKLLKQFSPAKRSMNIELKNIRKTKCRV